MKVSGKLKSAFLIAAIGIFMAFAALTFAGREMEKKPLLEEKLRGEGILSLAGFYLFFAPEQGERPYIGGSGAPITIAAYLAPGTESSTKFFSETLPPIRSEFADTGKARVYLRHFVTMDDYQGKTEIFIKSKKLDCIMRLAPENYALAFEQAADAAFGEDSYGAPDEKLAQCLGGPLSKTLLQDITETEHFGGGVAPRMYVGIKGRGNSVIEGIPNPDSLRRKLQDYRILLGD